MLEHMEFSRKKSKRGHFVLCSPASIGLPFLVICLLIILYSSLPDVSPANSSNGFYRKLMPRSRSEEVILGELGQMMVSMLPDDLAFTIFVPSEAALERVLQLRATDSLVEERINDTYAVLSRVMGFSAIPQHVPSGAVPFSGEITFDSVSGFKLYTWKDSDGALIVNSVRSEIVDLRKAEIIVHIMGGVIMDAEFEQSFSRSED